MKRAIPLAILAAMLMGCVLFPTTPGPKITPGPHQATDVGKAAGIIDEHAKAIAKEAPDETPHTDAIGEQTANLRAIQAQLKVNEKACDELKAQNVKLADKIKELQDAKNTLLKRWLALIAIACLIACPLALFLAKNVPLAVSAAAVFCLCISAEWMIQWAEQIAIGCAIGIALLVAWFIRDQRGSLRQTVAFVEKLKPHINPQAVKDAAAEQSARTRKVVDAIRAKIAPPPTEPPPAGP